MVEFAVGLQVDISLHLVSDREEVADLRPDADHPRLEAADTIARAAVAADLLIEVAHEADLPLLAQELRHAPVEVHVDAILVLSGGVYEVVGESKDRRSFMSGRLVEIGIAAASVDRPMPDPYICKTGRLVGADRDVSGNVGHEVVDASVPFHLEKWVQV